MNLRARLTLYYVLLAVAMVGLLSFVDLANDMDLPVQPDAGARRKPAHVRRRHGGAVAQPAAHPDDRGRLRDPELETLLRDTMLASHAILEIAVVAPDNRILADTSPEQTGKPLPHLRGNFRPLVTRTDWYDKWRVAAPAQVLPVAATAGPAQRPAGPVRAGDRRPHADPQRHSAAACGKRHGVP